MIFTPFQYSKSESGDWQNTGWLSNFTNKIKETQQAFDLLDSKTADKWITDFNQSTKQGTENLTTFFEKCKDPSLVNYLNNLKGGKATVEGYTAATKASNAAIEATGTASKAASIGMKALAVAENVGIWLAVTLAIQGVVKGIEYLATAQQRAIDKANELTSTYNSNIETINTNITNLQSLQTEFDSLAKHVDQNGNNMGLTTDQFKRYHEIVKQIVDIQPSLIKGFDDQNNAIVDNNSALQSAISYEQQQLELSKQNYLKDADKTVAGAEDEVGQHTENAKKNVKDFVSTLVEAEGKSLVSSKEYATELNKVAINGGNESSNDVFNRLASNKIGQQLGQLGINYQGLLNGDVEELNKVAGKQDEIIAKIKEQTTLTDGQKTAITNVVNKISTEANGITTANQKMVALVNTWASLSQNSSWYDQIVNSGNLQNFNGAIEKFIQDNPKATIDQIENAAYGLGQSFEKIQNQIPTDKIEQLKTDLANGKISTDDYNKGLHDQIIFIDKLADRYAKTNPILAEFLKLIAQGLADDFKQSSDTDPFSQMDSSLKQFNTDYSTAKTAIDNFATSLKDLNTAIDDQQKGTLLSGDQVATLINEYPQLTNKIIDTGNGYKFEKGALEEVRKAQIAQQTTAIQAQINTAQETLNATKSRLQNYSNEIGAIKTLTDAYAAMAKVSSATHEANQDPGVDKNSQEYKNYLAQQADIKASLAAYISASDEISKDQQKIDALKKGLSLVGSNNYQKTDQSQENKDNKTSTENTALKNAEALLDYQKQMGVYTSDNLYKQTQLNQKYLAATETLKKYAKTTEEIREVNERIKSAQDALLESQKNYQSDILTQSYAELDNRIALGKVQEGSIEQIRNLLEIQKNLNSAAMSLVNTKENQLELDKKIYDTEKQYQENVLSTSKNELQKRINVGTVSEGSKEQLQNLQEIYKNLTTNPNMEYANTEENRLDLEEQIYSTKKNILDTEQTELDNEVSLGKVQEGSLLYLQRLQKIKQDINNSDLGAADKAKELESIESKIYDAQSAYNDKQISELDHLVSVGKIQENSLEYVERLNALYRSLNLTLEQRESLQEKIFSAEKSYISQLSSDLADENIKGSYGYRMKAIQDQIDALNEENDATSKQIALEKAQAALEEARNQKTISIYRTGQGFVYEADQSSITEKQQTVVDAERDKQVDELTKKKQKIQDELNDQQKELTRALKVLEGYDVDSTTLWDDIQNQVEDVLQTVNDAISDSTDNNKKHYNSNSNALRKLIEENYDNYSTELTNLEQFSKNKQNSQNLVLSNDNTYSAKSLSIQQTMISQMRQNLLTLANDCLTYGKQIDTNLSNSLDKNKSFPEQTMGIIVQDMRNLITQLVTNCLTYGINIITQLDAGLNDKKARAKLTQDVNKIVNDIVDQFKEGFDIHSPSHVMYTIGEQIMHGLVNGLSDSQLTSFLEKQISDSIDSISNAGTNAMTRGVEQWKKVAAEALVITGHYSERNLQLLLEQMQTESGGNQNAINLWDSNAKAGHPSQGLMQVIPSTFNSYALPGYNKNILDPLSNIIAAIRYTYSRYGGLEGVWGTGRGYASGSKYIQKDEYSIVDENGDEIIIPPVKNGRLTALQKGSAVLPADLTNNIFAMASNPSGFISKYMSKLDLKPVLNVNVQGASGSSMPTVNHFDFDKLVLPNVTDLTEIPRQLSSLKLDAQQRMTKK